MRTVYIGVVCFLFFFASSPRADIYKYVDDSGVICYTDNPIDKKADRIYKDKSSTFTDKAQETSKDPSDYHRIIREKAQTYDIDPSLIKAVIETESNWNCMARSSKGAMGLMQLMPSTANDMDVRNPYNPEENIEGGTRYLKYLLERFKGDLTLALAAYNAGPNAVEKYGYVPPYTETRQYVNKVLSIYNGNGTGSHEPGNAKKPDKIYKVVLEDGSVLFTNSSHLLKDSSRF